ncbi:hypothetical protein IMCC12053_712 [Celeribacter marinus]|uniref:Uncharacterized protein n=1 Tax=Celeribacter marinus TaxID=1397108 RepID=A0A0N9ZX50_9RHOB|nr:hypothetical protein IMCC12053_712 [Celeribacter marinus]
MSNVQHLVFFLWLIGLACVLLRFSFMRRSGKMKADAVLYSGTMHPML